MPLPSALPLFAAELSSLSVINAVINHLSLISISSWAEEAECCATLVLLLLVVTCNYCRF